MIEIDLRRTGDGGIVVLHDPTLKRLWGLDRPVAEMDLAEVQAVGGASSSTRIPTLAEVLEEISLPLMVDFTKRDVVEGALAAVTAAGPATVARCLFVTGNVEALRLLRGLSSEVRIGLTWVEEGMPPSSLLIDELGAEYWNPMFSRITPQRVQAIHDLGLLVSCWTVDKKRDMRRLIGAGVDAMVSNRINDLRAVLDQSPR
jgi:glycerophosphoryl diester phosphodiesterase